MLKQLLLLTLLLNYDKIVQGKPASSEIQIFDEISSNFVNVFTKTTTEIATKEVQNEGNLTKNDDWTKCFKGLWNSMVSKFKAFQNEVEEGFINFVKLANAISYPFYHR